MKVILMSLILISSNLAMAKRNPASWVVTSRYENKPGTDIKRSAVQFQKGSSVSYYKPDEVPFGLVMNERKLIKGVEYFITGWALGARSLKYRIFSPETNGVEPLCEMVSFSEVVDLKIHDGALKLHVLENAGEEMSWETCATLKIKK